MPQIDSNKAMALSKMGITTLHTAPFYLPDNTTFEPPCSIKWMSIQESLFMGAFSYAVSGFYFACKIGRYVSIGEDVQIGRGSHPVNWISTSPFFYQDHKSVLNMELSIAKDFRPVTPHIAYKNTVIGNDVYIGHGAMIMQGLEIGDGAIVGARSVVTKDVPPYSIVAGSPAVVKKMRFNDAILERLSNIRWYDYAFWDLQNHDISRPHEFLDMIEDGVQKGKLRTYHPGLVSLADL